MSADAVSEFPPAAAAIARLIVPAHPETIVRPVGPADAPFLRALFADHRGAEFISMGLSDAMVSLMLDQQFRAQQMGYRQAFPQAHYLLIEHAAVPVGRLSVVVLNGEAGKALHIIDVAVLSSARRRGIGTDVISSLDHAARAMGATRVTLTVLQTNAQAIRLYERLGFVATDLGLYNTMVKPLP